jgi:hypothetical protein
VLLIEAGFVLLALLFTFMAPRIGSSFFIPIERRIAYIARHRRLAVLIVGMTALVLRAAVLPILPVPAPSGHDEFSYLLMADTFVHGRLTNPTPPLWIHFETVNVIFHPTYCSMYYPAQGAVLAIGQLLGNPFWGVWLSIGAMCAAICWMLQAWVGPFWAFLGGLLAAIRLGAFSYWANSYMGGAVAAIGGALVLGALPRFKQRQRVSDALMLGCGFALLIGTRPFEGLFFSIPVVCYLGVWIFRNKKIGFSRSSSKLILPSGLILLAAVGFMFYYFWRTTGHPLLPPYVVSLHTYSVDPSFPWLPERPVPPYNHEVLRRYWTGLNLDMFHMVREHPIFSVVIRFVMLWFFFLGPLLSLPFLALAFALPYGTSLKEVPAKARLLLLVCGVTFAGMLLPVYVSPHYAAPMTAAIYVLLMLALQRVRRWQAGPFVCRAVLVGALGLLLVRVAAPVLNLSVVNPSRPETWCSPWEQLLVRQTLEKGLEAGPGRHVVFVRYGLNSNSSSDDSVWVNNLADIDGSKVVWAHDMGQQNEELTRYFVGRKFWVLDVDKEPARFFAYEAAKNINGREITGRAISSH